MNFYAINQVLLDRLMVGPRFLEPLIGVRVPVEQQIFCYNKNIHMANLPFTPITTLELCLGIGAFIIITALALAVFFKNPKSWTNRFFVILSLLLDAYIIVNAFALHPIVPNFENQLFWIRFDMLLGAFASPTLLLLAHTFPGKSIKLHRKYLIPLFISTITCTVLAFTPFIFTSVSYPNGSLTPVPAPGVAIPFYFLHFVGLFVLSFIIMFKNYNKAVGIDRVRTLYLLIGSVGTFSLLAIFIFLFTVIFGNTSVVFLGPIFPVILMSFIGYSIIKHKFLDIQPIIARAVSYTFLVGLLAGIYAVLIFYGANKFLGQKLELGLVLINASLAVIIILTFQPLYRVVQKLTDKILFKGVYNADKILSDLTHAITSTINFDELADKLLATINEEMRASKSALLLVDNNLIVSTKTNRYSVFDNLSEEVAQDFTNPSQFDGKRFLTFDDLADSAQIKLFRNLDIEAVFPIRAEDKLVAILVLGTKSSGIPYSAQDLNLLDVFASEAGVAIQNARLYNNLKIALESKTKFINVASHQLRTPIAGIKWGLETLVESGEVKQGLPVLNESYAKVSFLGEQLDDILTALDIYNKNLVLQKSPCDLAKIFEEVIAPYIENLQKNKILIKSTFDSGARNISLDLNKIKKVIKTLVKNAIVYSEPGQTITIKTKTESVGGINNLIVEISDQGIGINPDEQKHIFDEFFRSDRAVLKLPDGLGLSMFIAKSYIEASGGKIWVESNGADNGLKVSFSLPL